MNHLRSWDTVTAVSKSKMDLERVLKRYGAASFGLNQDYSTGRFFVAFSMPKSLRIKGTERTQIRLPVEIEAVRARLELIPQFHMRDEGWKAAQAERVAWRHILLLVEAALAAADSQVQTLEQALFAHSLVDTPRGPMLAGDVINEMRRLTAGAK